MLDIHYIRKNPLETKEAVKNKGESVNIDNLLRIDEERRRLIFETDELKAKKNKASNTIAKLKKEGKDTSKIITQMQEIAKRQKEADKKLKDKTREFDREMLLVPNVASQDVPIGEDDKANIEVRRWGKRKEFDFEPLAHWDIGKNLDILDIERGAKITGSGFVLFKGLGAMLQRALINFMLDLHIQKHGYTEVFPPVLVNRNSMINTGQLPKLEEDMYKTADDLFLVPTSEVSVVNIYKDEIISHSDLPIKFTAYSPCFRREAGAHGKDTRGLLRVHQFEKIELIKFVRPEDTYSELETMVQDAEEVMQFLELEYRVTMLCTGELSFASHKTYDIEGYAPAIDRFLEISSCSTTTDFQARRANIRYRDEDGSLGFLHILNGSGVALARLIVCILETYQQKDGSVKIPTVLYPYMGGIEVIK